LNRYSAILFKKGITGIKADYPTKVKKDGMSLYNTTKIFLNCLNSEIPETVCLTVAFLF
jgi:hypothetical protein